VVGGLVLLSLLLITISFREPTTGVAHGVEAAGATVLRPFEVAAERVARPFRDVYGYFAGLYGAKEEAERLRRANAALALQAIQNETALRDAESYRRLLDLSYPAAFPDDFRRVAATITAYPPTQFEQRVVISSGTDDGIALNDAVVNGDGLIGRIVGVSTGTAKVLLLTDQESAASALDISAGSTATGLVQAGRAGSGALLFNAGGKDERVQVGDWIVTRGSREGELESLYPRAIPIGVVTFVGQTDTDPYKRIQLDPYVDFDDLDRSVIVLVPKGRR
jgi:rod shape-determining protein MreC